MKCSLCGNEKFKEIKIIDCEIVSTDGYVKQAVNSFACENCGHVELFLNKDAQKHLEEKNKNKFIVK